MKFEITIYRPGIAGYERKTGEPIAFEPVIEHFEAKCATEAENKAAEIYKRTGLGAQGHYNFGIASEETA